MKGLKKLALATAVAAAPFAQAEMTAMDDSALSQMTGQAGITIDVDLQMSIDAIKYVDVDGNAGGAAKQGAITMKGIRMGNLTEDGTYAHLTGTDANGVSNGAATIRGITVDADGTNGLVIGLNQIGDDQGNGIDIAVDAILINDGKANLNAYNTVANFQTQSLNGSAFSAASTYNYADFTDGTVKTDMVTSFVTDASAEIGAAAANVTNEFAQANGYADATDLQTKLATGTQEEQGQAAATVVGFAAMELQTEAQGGAAASAESNALAPQAADFGVVKAAGDSINLAGAGNIGGIVIEDFRNYIQDDIVQEYNSVFDMALQDSTNAVIGDQNSTATGGRFVRGEIKIEGTGQYTGDAATTTGGLKISGKFGGAMDKAAWVDNNGGEFGVKDMGFFHGEDTDLDGISDTIEGMGFSVNIDVVDHVTSVDVTNVADGSTIAADGTNTVAALKISDMEFKGTIMMGQIYVGTNDNTVQTSLGSVLVKDINMQGTNVYVYGH